MMRPLDIPAFLRREPGSSRNARPTERVWLKGEAPKPPFKKQVKALVALGWSKYQAGSVSRAEAAMAIRLQSPATARFMTDLWKDGGDGKPS